MSLATSPVLDARGQPQPLGELLIGPTLLLFLRHWGCMECSLLLSDLLPHLATLRALGVRVVMVGNGSPGGIDDFRARYKLNPDEATVVTDPTLGVHRHAGLERSLWGASGPRAIWTLVTGWGQGHPNRMGDGDVPQQGGALLVDADGAEVWRHSNHYLGDHVAGTAVLEAATRLVAQERAWAT